MQKLKEFRIEKGLTQAEMSRKMGLSLSMYTKIEIGKRGISKNFIKKFHELFPDVDCWNFFFLHNST